MFAITKGVKKLKLINLQSTFMLCLVLFLQILINVFLLKGPNVRPSTRNSLGNSFQSFAPVNFKLEWPIVDFTLGRRISLLSLKVLPRHSDPKVT